MSRFVRYIYPMALMFASIPIPKMATIQVDFARNAIRNNVAITGKQWRVIKRRLFGLGEAINSDNVTYHTSINLNSVITKKVLTVIRPRQQDTIFMA